MRSWVRITHVVAPLTLLLAPSILVAAETQLFDGKSLNGWTFHQQEDEAVEVQDPWIVQRGLLICRGVTSGYLIHKDEFEDYVLTFELRTMSTEEGNGTAIGSLGSVYLNAAPEQGAFSAPKSIEISLRDSGNVFFRDLDDDMRHDTDAWVFRAPDFADDVDRDMGEWNHIKLISNGKRLTVIFNGKVVNQVEPINRAKGSVALRSSRGFVAAPTFYRNLVIKPIAAADLALEKTASAQFAKVTAAIAKRKAAEEAARAATEKMQVEAQNKLAKEWAGVQVSENVDFKADVRHLPYLSNAREIEFQAAFNEVEYVTSSSLAELSKFYSTEMARRGWKVTETELEEDEVTVMFQHGEAEVELNLDKSSDGVDVSLDCEGLSFAGTDDPAGLVTLGVPQPDAYLVLQRELKLPESYRDQEYDMDKRRLFKSTLKLAELYEFLTQQLRQKGYRETRRPIVTGDRRYSEFAKGGVEISVNAFSHPIGSRVVLTFEKD